MIQERIEKLVQGALTACGFRADTVPLMHPTDFSHGDYATSVALILAKETGKNPREVAEQIVAALDKADWLERVEIAGPGFVNFYLARSFFRDAVREACAQGAAWGKGSAHLRKKVMVEYTDPNPFKPFHIGHLMSNTLGESIARLYRFAGAEVRTANWQGDVGLHVAKALWGLRRLQGDPSNVEDLGRAYVEGNRAYEDEDTAKVEIAAFNKLVYEQAPEILEAYRTGRAVSLAHFEELYKTLGTTFDYYFFESEGTAPGRALVKEGLAQGIFEESEGAVVFKGETYGLHTRVFLTKQGLPTYEAKDLGLAHLKAQKWDFDLSVITTAVEQKEYFKVLLKALSLLRPALAEKTLHVSHGMMQLTSGKMSSRKGNIITGESLIADMLSDARAKVALRDLPEEDKEAIARAVAVGAIKYAVLKQKAGKNIVFDPAQSLSFEGDSGPYLQYAHTRARSVLAKGEAAHVTPRTELAPKETTDVERLLYRFPEVVSRAALEHEPHYVTTYLIELAGVWNSWYAGEKILDGSLTAPYKLAIAEAVAHTLKNGLWLLGIEAPERM